MTCVFCKIISSDIPATKEYEDSDLIAIQDIHPKAPVHLLIISKEHIPSLNEMTEASQPLLGKMIWQASRLAADKGIDGKGYKVVINCGPEGGQTVPHLHLHLIGGKNVAGIL